MLDLSDKIDAFTLEVIKLINNTAIQLNIDFLLIGATARDIILEKEYGIRAGRATNDIDFSVRVGSWDDYRKLINELLNAGFKRSDVLHRFSYKDIPSIDVIPFGKISVNDVTIKWPDIAAKEMTVLGFNEAMANSEIMIISHSPEVSVRIASLPSLVMLKFISWKDAFPARERDASDILFIVQNYINAGNMDTLINDNAELMEVEFDFDILGSRLLGRHIAKIINEHKKNFLTALLEEETNETGKLRFIEDMIKSNYLFDIREGKYEHYLNILRSILHGLND
ncbi:MAG: nucleotidyl transferase AbiEii/AbiGii toxin family protein [Bacteroidota bacterium]|nr:nucleotidyl transferase AbiEii/AbiGii toxin family protein [Bacteroidota bacterium]